MSEALPGYERKRPSFIQRAFRRLTGQPIKLPPETIVTNEEPSPEEMKQYKKDGVTVEVDPGLPPRDRGGWDSGEEEEE